MEPGESWAYRARQTDPLVEVRVLRVGTKRPVRVLVRFVAEESEGREEWVPPNRLKVLWDQAEAFRAREERWARVSSFGPARQDPVWDAADHVVRLAFGEGVLFPYDDGGVLQIEDSGGVAASLGLEMSDLGGHPASFWEGRSLVVPWPVTKLVVNTAARLHADEILSYVRSEERKAQSAAIYGRRYKAGRDDWHVTEPEDCIELDDQHGRPVRTILRQWCGPDAVDRFDELSELRAEVRRIGLLAQAAIDALQACGQDQRASALQRELGVPVEVLRASR